MDFKIQKTNTKLAQTEAKQERDMRELEHIVNIVKESLKQFVGIKKNIELLQLYKADKSKLERVEDTLFNDTPSMSLFNENNEKFEAKLDEIISENERIAFKVIRLEKDSKENSSKFKKSLDQLSLTSGQQTKKMADVKS